MKEDPIPFLNIVDFIRRGDEVVVKPISSIEALTHLKGLIRFQADEVFTADDLNVLRRKISTFEYLIDKAKKQSSIDCYLEK